MRHLGLVAARPPSSLPAGLAAWNRCGERRDHFSFRLSCVSHPKPWLLERGPGVGRRKKLPDTLTLVLEF